MAGAEEEVGRVVRGGDPVGVADMAVVVFDGILLFAS